MTEQSPSLMVSMMPSGLVEFRRGSGVTLSLWQQTINWWRPVIQGESGGTNFTVSIADFAVRKKWLRAYWADLGYSLTIKPGIKEGLRDLDVKVSAFEKLAFSAWEPTEDELRDYEPPLKRNLTDFQKRNVLCLLRMPNGANFSVPGAGKTATALLVWAALCESDGLKRLLVVTPRSAFETWEREPTLIFERPPKVAIFNAEPIDPETIILVVNYEQLENNDRLVRIERWMQQKKTALVIDEAHRIKGGGASVRWRACSQLSASASRTDLLTGTPLPQGLDDLKNLISVSWKELPSQYLSISKIQALRRGGIFVRTTKDELALPPVTIREVPIPMGEIQSQIYSALGRAYAGQLNMNIADTRYFRQRGRAVLTLLGAATNPGLLMKHVSEDAYLGLTWPPKEITANPFLTDVVNSYSQHEIPPKYEWLANMVRSRANNGQKVLVWSNFVGNLQAMEKLLAPFNPVLIYGGTTGEERIELLRRYRLDSSCSVLLSNPQTLGEGISLHEECHEAVYVDRSYNAGHYLQSLDRIHRLGLSADQQTNVHFLVSERSIDERVQSRLAVKIDRLAGIMNDHGLVAGTMPNENEDAELNYLGLETEDLADLFQHLKKLSR